MEDPTHRGGSHDLDLASRRAEEAAWRRYQAAQWLSSLVGPIGAPVEPTEREFISCLRNGLVLCNVINKIQPGSIPKVVECPSVQQPLSWDSRPLPAYQYFENVRNFLVAVEELKLPAFEASDLERDKVEAGSCSKVVDCVLALKAYRERKQVGGGNGNFKPLKSPMPQGSPLVLHSDSRTQSRASGAITSVPCRQLEMSKPRNNQQLAECEAQKLEGLIVKAIAECMVDTKENMDSNFLTSFHSGDMDPVKLFRGIMSSSLEKQLQIKFPELHSIFKDILGGSVARSASEDPTESLSIRDKKSCRACSKKGSCNHWHVFEMQEKELMTLKELLSGTKRDFEELHLQLQNDLKQMGRQVEKLSAAAQGYHKVVKENRKLYNMVQDLKGNIRVYCRIRPVFNGETKTVVDFIGEDGSLVVLDPLKHQKDGRKVFQFNHVFGPSATQEELYKETQSLIRSVMDGYNVCIFAYGQTGSGKTHTMCGPSGGSTRDLGINYLALSDLFQLSNRRKDIVKYDISVQMVEIYNEQVRDLLAKDSSATKLEIRSCTSENGLSLPDATMHTVVSTTDVLNLMKLGDTNRVVCSTAINTTSSRSHSILTVHVHGKDVSGSILRSCLHLVDLAGSERIDKSEVTGDSLKEAQYINKSLSCLGDVITALAQKNSHIPYRNSKLTLLLQNSIGGHAKTLMLAHVSPEVDSFGETISTLKFAQRVSTVELGAASMNKESGEVMELKEQIESLKKALENKEARSVQTTKTKEPKSPLAMTDRTPPRPRRLSIENCNSMTSQGKRGLKTPVQTRSRRLSLEGPRLVHKDPIQMKQFEVVSQTLQTEAVPLQMHGQLKQGNEAALKHVNQNMPMVDMYLQRTPRSPTSASFKSQVEIIEGRTKIPSLQPPKTPPRSPTSASYKIQVGKVDGRTKIPSLQQPKTPDRPMYASNKIQIPTQGQPDILVVSQSPISTSTSRKGSQIRKSLRTIGNLIGGSEKRNQKKLVDASPMTAARKISEPRSPVSTNARPLRRQSLTGVIQMSDSSRRDSLGGSSTASCKIGNRNAKTPPPVHPSTKSMSKWL